MLLKVRETLQGYHHMRCAEIRDSWVCVCFSFLLLSRYFPGLFTGRDLTGGVQNVTGRALVGKFPKLARVGSGRVGSNQVGFGQRIQPDPTRPVGFDPICEQRWYLFAHVSATGAAFCGIFVVCLSLLCA